MTDNASLARTRRLSLPTILTFSIVTRLPSKVARAVRATSGAQLRVLLGGIDDHQAATITTGKSAATNPLRKGRTRAARSKLVISTVPAAMPASAREAGPSNHSASALHATPTTASTDSSTVEITWTVRRSFNGFSRARTGCGGLLRLVCGDRPSIFLTAGAFRTGSHCAGAQLPSGL